MRYYVHYQEPEYGSMEVLNSTGYSNYKEAENAAKIIKEKYNYVRIVMSLIEILKEYGEQK